MVAPYGYFQKYAALLDEGELLDLFDLVKSEARSLSEAARKCGIERKTIYDMMNEGKQVKTQTKQRILMAALATDFEKGTELLLSKAMRESREILLNYVSLVYQKAMRAQDASNFNAATSNLELILDRYAGIVAADLQEEVTSLVNELVSKGLRLGIRYSPPTPKVMDTGTLAVVVPALVRDLVTMPGRDLMDLASKWRIEPSVVGAISDSIGKMSDLRLRRYITVPREYSYTVAPIPVDTNISREYSFEIAREALSKDNIFTPRSRGIDSAQNVITIPAPIPPSST